MRNKETTQKIVKNNYRYHWRNFFRSERFVFAFEFNFNFWFARDAHNLKRPMFHIFLDASVSKISSNQTFGIEYSVVWVHCYLVFGSIANQTFGVGKCNIRRSCPISLEKKLKSYWKENYFFQNLWKSRCHILVTFPSHLKKLRSTLRFWLEKSNCGFFHSFHSWKYTTKQCRK